MKKWQIIQIIFVAIMFATSIAGVWVDDSTWELVLEISYCTALLLVCVIMGIICCIQQKELNINEKGFSVNVATYKDGVFESYTTKTPDYWMEVPQIQNEEKQ